MEFALAVDAASVAERAEAEADAAEHPAPPHVDGMQPQLVAARREVRQEPLAA